MRRGEADADALETARAILGDGGVVVVFPEGTRVDEPDALGSPHHGAGRLARETGAPIVPTAILGTSHLWLGPIPKPRRVDVSFLPAGARRARRSLIDERVWPAVQDEYGRLRATPGAIAAALAAVGLGGLVARRRLELERPPRLLGVIPPRRQRRRRPAARCVADRGQARWRAAAGDAAAPARAQLAPLARPSSMRAARPWRRIHSRSAGVSACTSRAGSRRVVGMLPTLRALARARRPSPADSSVPTTRQPRRPADASISASSEALTPRGSTITGHCASAVRRRDTPPSSTARSGP